MEAIEAVSRERAHRKHVVVLGQDDVWRSLTLHMAPSDQPMIFLSIRTQARTDDLAMEPLIEAFHLTPAQAKVVMGLASGLVPKEIARRMDVSTHTVRTHLRAVYGKLKVRGIAGALRLTSQLLD
jgi:DNA-binding CsgD family transcriptional regulator